MNAQLHVGIWQSTGAGREIAANLDEVGRAAGEAKRLGVDLLVLPECFVTGYYFEGDVAEIAADIGPDVISRLVALSAAEGVALAVGSYENGEGCVHNGAFIVTPEHGHVGTYRKRALFGDWERRTFTPGRDPFLFDFKGFRIGLNICYDIEFPERVRELARAGADLVICPTAVMAPYDMVPRCLVQARAFENHLFVAYANRVGTEGPLHYLGLSRIAGPAGNVVAEAGEGPELIHAVLALADRDAARQDYDYLDDLARQV
ncbi:nitrilase-related carbon-nitrogen hydrolase [Sulfitobacter sp. LCG007]